MEERIKEEHDRLVEVLKDLVIWSIETDTEGFVEELRRNAKVRGIEKEIEALIREAYAEWMGEGPTSTG